MKIVKPEELYDHTVRFEYDEREEVYAFLTKNNVVFKNWNGGIVIVKRTSGVYVLPDNHNGMGYFEVYWHKDVKQFIDCETAKSLRKRYKTHNDIVIKMVDLMDDLEDVKEGIEVC